MAVTELSVLSLYVPKFNSTTPLFPSYKESLGRHSSLQEGSAPLPTSKTPRQRRTQFSSRGLLLPQSFPSR